MKSKYRIIQNKLYKVNIDGNGIIQEAFRKRIFPTININW